MANSKYLKIYTEFLKKQADIKKPLKIVLDCSNGPAGLVLKRLKIPNSRFYILNSKIDGRFPAHGPNPLELRAINDVRDEIKRQKADLGAVYDADADRAVFIDNLGRPMPFFAISYLLTLQNQPPYVGDIYVAKTMERLGMAKFTASPVGTYNMKQTIRKIRASFGSEISGHYYFREIKNADSAILATIKVFNALTRLPYTSAQFSDLLPDFYYQQFNQKTKKPAALVAKTAKIYSKKAKKISRLDGFLFDFGEWFLIVRPSNTESLVRFFVGSQSKKTFRRELARLKNLLP